jgi:hypothetical protein
LPDYLLKDFKGQFYIVNGVKSVSIDAMYDIDKHWAYFLGFFWGDGSIRGTASVIGITNKDGECIENIFERCISYKKRLYSPVNRQPQAFYYFGDKCFRKFLFEYDFWDKSALSPTKILNIIPFEFKRYFWLGFIDADGCFYKSKAGRGGRFSISGSHTQDWSDFLLLLTELDIENHHLYRNDYGKGKSSRIEISYGPDLVRLGNFIYGENFDLGLKRKYLKYLEIKQSLPILVSQWKGVSFHKGEKKWRAYVKRKFLGWFDTEEGAHNARIRFLAAK